MELKVTSEAKTKLQSLNPENKRYLRLFYDTEGCGCGVNGVPTLRWTEKRTDWDQEVESDEFEVIVHKQQAVFFNKQLRLAVSNGSLRLSSPNEILNPVIPGSEVMKGDSI
ncbi:iron-sulfur cluster biosynthesis family protein [Thalassobacillus devorans]|uniref:iron-sulfur cluster biosynthesis family protein n=1 Tax=Thalassobacillus devorans TaxID=279813 RepID=UPI00048CB4B2|nr:iron-sulfur cluster biosynthesis family protein [Thalassobacillus devorans]